MIQIRAINNYLTLGMLDLEAFSAEQVLAGKREIEKAGTLYLLEKMLNSKSFELNYTEHNKPFLVGHNMGISISHSRNKLAIIFNSCGEAGIDIELVQDKVMDIQGKFLSQAERTMAADNPDKLITYWAAKEALYKYYGLKGLDFKEHLIIEEDKGHVLTARLETGAVKRRYHLACEDSDGYKLVYVTHEI